MFEVGTIMNDYYMGYGIIIKANKNKDVNKYLWCYETKGAEEEVIFVKWFNISNGNFMSTQVSYFFLDELNERIKQKYMKVIA